MEQTDIHATGALARRLTKDEPLRTIPIAAPFVPTARLRGDCDLNPGLEPSAVLRDAAVLVPLVAHADGMTVIFTQRTAHLAAHAGQISFPGGRLEPEDAGPEEAALRETEEEIGLPPAQVQILGRLDTYITRTGFRVVPIVGLVEPPLLLTPDPTEVAEVFEVPLGFLMAPDSLRRDSRELLGDRRHFYAFSFGERYIWGATAGMIVNLREVMRQPC